MLRDKISQIRIELINYMLELWGGARVYAAGARVYASLVILVSALGPNFGLGLGLGPGLDNTSQLN